MKITIYILNLVLFLTILSGCISQKSDKSAACAEDQVFDSVSRSCVQARIFNSAATPSLNAITILEDSINNSFELSYTSSKGQNAIGCQVLLVDSNLKFADPLGNSTKCSCQAGVCRANIVSLPLNFNGASYFSYTITDELGVSNAKRVTVNVTPVNDAPTCHADIPITTAEDTPTSSILTTCTDIDGDFLNYEIITPQAQDASVDINEILGTFVYTPKENFPFADPSGTDSFAFRACDTGVPRKCSDDGAASPTEVTVTVTQVWDAPQGTLSNWTFAEGAGPYTKEIVYTDGDGHDADSCAITKIDDDLKGGAAAACACDPGTCKITLTPNPDFFGSANFSYTMTDGEGAVSVAKEVTVTVTSVNDAPTFVENALSLTCTEDVVCEVLFDKVNAGNSGDTLENAQTVSAKVVIPDTSSTKIDSIKIYYNDVELGNSSDGNYHEIGVASSINPSKFKLKVTPVAEFSGAADIELYLKDSDGAITDADDATISLNFTEVNDPPVITADATYSMNQGGDIVIPITVDEGGGAGEDGQELTIKIESNNHALLPESTSNIEIYYDVTQDDVIYASKKLGYINGPLGDGALDASAKKVYLRLKPVASASGIVEVKISATDNHASPETTDKIITLTVHSISATHGGWKNITAVGPKIDKDNTPVKTYCDYTSDCGSSGNSACLGSGSPITNSVTGALNSIYYDSSNYRCYKMDALLVWQNYTDNASITLEWNSFVIAGSGENATVTISGWKVYRRKLGEYYDYENALNSSLLSISTRTYTDKTAKKNQVYFYKVVPIDSKRSLITHTQEAFSEVRIIAPPDNSAFVPRFMMNKEVCEMMHKTPDGSNNFRCVYAGPGSTEGYYDVGKDLIVDIAEAGCPYSPASVSGCEPDGCIGVGAPGTKVGLDDADDETVYYNRMNGICYVKDGAGALGWKEFDAALLSDADQTKKVHLPPLVNITQSIASSACSARSDLTGSIAGTSTSEVIAYKIPSRLEQIAYSSWSSSYTDAAINNLEIGLALNSSSGCNSSSAGGLDFGFVDADIPSGPYMYSLPGTAASGIRSIYTGSISTPLASRYLTESCVSRYGIQDVYGNVKEWVSDTITCTANNACTTSWGAGYKFDGAIGPGGGDPLTEWYFYDTDTFDATKFLFPLGLPLVDADATDGGLLIGYTSGIPTAKFHNDFIDMNITGGFSVNYNIATGGSYLSEKKSGRYAISLEETTNSAVDIGFRCIAEIEDDDYDADGF